MADQPPDVASTLNELERKLLALERDLRAVAPEQAPPVAARAPASELDAAAAQADDDPERIVAQARRRVADLRAELDELARTREQLTDRASEAVGYRAAPDVAAPVPRPLAPENMLQQGAVAIDAGFFRDLTSLSTFEQSLARVPGVVGVHVRGFEQGRAVIDAQLSHPIALGADLARYAPLRFTVTDAGPQHLMLAISS